MGASLSEMKTGPVVATIESHTCEGEEKLDPCGTKYQAFASAHKNLTTDNESEKNKALRGATDVMSQGRALCVLCVECDVSIGVVVSSGWCDVSGSTCTCTTNGECAVLVYVLLLCVRCHELYHEVRCLWLKGLRNIFFLRKKRRKSEMAESSDRASRRERSVCRLVFVVLFSGGTHSSCPLSYQKIRRWSGQQKKNKKGQKMMKTEEEKQGIKRPSHHTLAFHRPFQIRNCDMPEKKDKLAARDQTFFLWERGRGEKA